MKRKEQGRQTPRSPEKQHLLVLEIVKQNQTVGRVCKADRSEQPGVGPQEALEIGRLVLVNRKLEVLLQVSRTHLLGSHHKICPHRVHSTRVEDDIESGVDHRQKHQQPQKRYYRKKRQQHCRQPEEVQIDVLVYGKNCKRHGYKAQIETEILP